AITRPQLLRVDADILCLQEANGDPTEGGARDLVALKRLIASTPYETYNVFSTVDGTGQVFTERNLAILSRFPFVETQQFQHNFQHICTPPPMHRKSTAIPPETEAKTVEWERPFLYAKIQVSGAFVFHVMNVHLKSKIPTDIAGQRIDQFTWKTISGFAEGF